MPGLRGVVGGLIAVAVCVGQGAEGRVLVGRAAAVTDSSCIDTDNANPPNFHFGYPTWRPADNMNCKSLFPVGADGQCFNHINPSNKCNAFCDFSYGWYYGQPVDTMDGRWCQLGQDCSKSISVGKTSGDSVSTSMDGGGSNSTTTGHKIGNSYSNAINWSIASKPEIAWISWGSLTIGQSFTHAYDTGRSWSTSINEAHGFSIGNSTSWSLSVSETDGLVKPAYASNYCGSWFIVPVLGATCGRGARGDLTTKARGAGGRGSQQCALHPKTASFHHCSAYGYKDVAKEKDTIKYKWVFVLRDCENGWVLPGEWQHPLFRNSFTLQDYGNYHLARFGFAPSENFRRKPEDDAWTSELIHSAGTFTKTIGPDDYNLEVCGRGKYCVRHRLTDGNCYNFPRGYLGEKSVHLVSAKTSPGTCCVLFSRPECFGLPQMVTGDIDDLAAVGYEGLAHSVVCGVDEYCNPARREHWAA
ncbi:hypothetical protein B0T19DRAFT_468426 [Cercophora scortea]|uniref:Uncharacterized protein n=1 Tax=Cercophora scortea TaxID=314031 RepID=A0AAE0I9I4_9PEZI|nr:hypothetical protein B0T19DRAFT_468426 [Cercophora scortea]